MLNRRAISMLRVASAGVRLLTLAAAVLIIVAGCKTSPHSSDPHVRKIDEMLDKELPKGTSMERVTLFLNERGYRIENRAKAQTIVAVVRQIDTETLRPENARVTFHFDAHNQLTSYELVSSADEPLTP
jgi:hypothetical protein